MARLFRIGLLVAVGTISGCCRPGIIGSLTVPLRPQETPVWCWAASGEMVMDFLGTNVSQCDEANKRFGRSDCCNSPRPNACVNTGWPEFGKYNFDFKTTSNAPLSWDQVKSQIWCKRKPVAFSWHWNGGGGHMMVLYGYVTVAGTNYVTIHDPLPVNVGDSRVITYSAYVSGAGYTHWNDYYDITPK